MTERFLANENFPAVIVRELRAGGHDVAHAAEDASGASDEVVLARGFREDRILLTFDRDFGALIFRQSAQPAPGVVLFRVAVHSPAVVLPLLRQFFSASVQLRGAFTVVSPGQVRQVPIPAFPRGA